MKKLASILVLLGIILGSFFAQEASASSWNAPVTIHANGANSGNQNFHKKIVFSEISSETEDSESRNSEELNFIYIYDVAQEIRYIKNILSTFFIHAINNQQETNSLPLFLAVRSIKI